jgi:hypothetical protein
MGLFNRRRYGSVETTVCGREFVWRLDDFMRSYKCSQMDSPSMISFQGISFHLRIVRSKDYVGLFISYKSQHPVPKYWFAFEGTRGKRLCEVSANDPPPDASCCGHSCAASKHVLDHILRNDGDCLTVLFRFDDDIVEAVAEGFYLWRIKNVSRILNRELHSKIFRITSSNPNSCIFFKLISDHLTIDFRIAHKLDIPPFAFKFITTHNTVAYSSVSMAVLPTRDSLLQETVHDDTFVVQVAFIITALPRSIGTDNNEVHKTQGASPHSSIPPTNTTADVVAKPTIQHTVNHKGAKDQQLNSVFAY